MQAVDRFTVAMGYVAAAICDQEAHNLIGVSTWRANLLSERDELVEADPPARVKLAAVEPERTTGARPGRSAAERFPLYLALCEEALLAISRREPVEDLRLIVMRATALQRRERNACERARTLVRRRRVGSSAAAGNPVGRVEVSNDDRHRVGRRLPGSR